MHVRIRTGTLLLLASLWTLPASAPALAQAPERHAVLIGGLGGTDDHTARFRQYLFDTRRAMVDRFGVAAERITVLAEPAIAGEDFVSGESTAENIRATFETLVRQSRRGDEVFVVLFGHGSFDGEHAHLNIPRRDLSDADYAALLDGLEGRRVVFINTASASGPFAETLSGPDRIVVTATRTGTQRNETVFPGLFVDALVDPAADLNRDGDLAVGELFRYTSAQTDAYFESESTLATEHALLEDSGDGKGFRAGELDDEGEGGLAAATFLLRGSTTLAAAGNASPDQLRERETLEREIDTLKQRKNQLTENDYYAQLETLFIQLARLNARIEQGQP